jgi:anion-transporting  ArsA/GET3 family ATPase
MKDILILGKVKQLERAGAADVLLLDAPASGHAITFLRSARGLLDAARVGPIHSQARDVLELLTDADRCQVLLATLPEETPVNELIETAYSLEEDVGVKLGPVIVNGRYPALALPSPAEAARLVQEADGDAGAALVGAATFRQRRAHLQATQVARLASALPLPQLATSFRFTPRLGAHDVAGLAAELADGIRNLG